MYSIPIWYRQVLGGGLPEPGGFGRPYPGRTRAEQDSSRRSNFHGQQGEEDPVKSRNHLGNKNKLLRDNYLQQKKKRKIAQMKKVRQRLVSDHLGCTFIFIQHLQKNTSVKITVEGNK